MDLPRFDGTELDMNLAAMDQAPLTVQDLLPPASTPAEPPREKRRRSKRRQDKDKQYVLRVLQEIMSLGFPTRSNRNWAV